MYNLLFWNCEHFAKPYKYNVSEQIENKVAGLVLGSTDTGAMIGGTIGLIVGGPAAVSDGIGAGAGVAGLLYISIGRKSQRKRFKFIYKEYKHIHLLSIYYVKQCRDGWLSMCIYLFLR